MNPEKPHLENMPDSLPVDISEADVVEAMKEIGGYLDITPGDLREVLRIAHRQARKRIANSVLVKNIMTTTVHAVREDTPLSSVADLMAEHHISGVPVLDYLEKVSGIISERDFISQMGKAKSSSVMGMIAGLMKGKACPAEQLHTRTAADIMTSPVITVRDSMTLFELMELFTSRKINHAPVVDAENRLRGIVSRNDIVRSTLSGMR
ncbi:MAG: CBS domain-containing protein [Thermodesulfovibrio sp.]|nr:CBS domain-containing protein [Thermodesulfovibrio sp.]